MTIEKVRRNRKCKGNKQRSMKQSLDEKYIEIVSNSKNYPNNPNGLHPNMRKVLNTSVIWVVLVMLTHLKDIFTV